MAHHMEVLPGDPTAVVVKRAAGSGAADLRLEGERLRAAAHPGVVEVLSSSGSDDAWELRLAHAGRPLATMGSLTTVQAAGLAASLAATLADLHDASIVHGRVEPAHVLISGQGHPVLCGFGPSTTASAADDVAGVGALLADLLGTATDMEPIPERRWRRRSWAGWDRRGLLLLADQACADPPSRRPTARRLAAAITATVPDALLRSPAATSSAAPSLEEDPIEALRSTVVATSDPARPRLPLLAGAAAAVVLVAVGGVRSLDPGGTGSTVPTAVRPTSTSTADLPPTTTTTRPEVPPRPCVVLPGTAPGGCASVQVAGTTVLSGQVRYEVGEPGDELVLGDWDCDGAATPALLRPATGHVFVFPAWAVADDVVVPPAARVEGAIDLEVVRGPGGCADLVARTPSGAVPLDLEGAA